MRSAWLRRLCAAWLACVPALALAAPDDCAGDAVQRILSPSALAVPSEAVWLNRQLIRWPGHAGSGRYRLLYSHKGDLTLDAGTSLVGHADGALVLQPAVDLSELDVATRHRFAWLPDGVTLRVAADDLPALPALWRDQLVLVEEDQTGKIMHATGVQLAGALDDWYRAAQQVNDLGATVQPARAGFALWAPTAQQVAVCVFRAGGKTATMQQALRSDPHTGVWHAHIAGDWRGSYYTYLVDVVVPGVGVVRNRVTDPYSVSLNADSRRSYMIDLSDPRTLPPGWGVHAAPATVHGNADMTVYELHVRDFSINDTSVSAAHRGKFMAFTEAGSAGMQHLARLAQAGVTDIHLLPVFDFASVPERGCQTPRIDPAWPADSLLQQQAVRSLAEQDCFNWGYDPYHYNAPEGSYATDPDDGATRIREMRAMVEALHGTGLRVGMDVVYNHTFAAGQSPGSVLDRIVPGYYQRLDEHGAVTQSTCCANTATENAMMGKLLVDSVLQWATRYHIDSFRFDLMAHQPRALMEQLQMRLRAVTGHPIELIGEGWNFGEVADGARFVQASQLSLNGSGIGTFNDRLRDAVRGGSAGDSGADLAEHKGFINGARGVTLQQSMDWVRAGLAGSVRSYPMPMQDGRSVPLAMLDYHGQPTGYASEPGEAVNYVENHDNQTLFDINALRLPGDTSAQDRARVQILGAAAVAFSQGVAYFHAGVDLLRSKSLDSNSFNSGDWFNRIDWRGQDNYFGSGLPPEPDNAKNYPWLRAALQNPLIKPGPAEIAWTSQAFRDLLQIRASSRLFHLASAAEVQQRLRFLPGIPGVALVAARLDGTNLPGANFRSIVYIMNADRSPQQLSAGMEQNKHYILHPVLDSSQAADQRVRQQAHHDASTGQFFVPALSAVVFVER